MRKFIMKSKKLLGLALFVLLLILFYFFITYRLKSIIVDSFEECVAAGYPVQESYPEKCVANGKTFVNEELKDESIFLTPLETKLCTETQTASVYRGGNYLKVVKAFLGGEGNFYNLEGESITCRKVSSQSRSTDCTNIENIENWEQICSN